MDTRKLLVEMLADWDDLQDQLEIVASVLTTRLAKRRNVSTEGVLKLIQHHFLLAALRVPGEFNAMQARMEFEKALAVIEVEKQVHKSPPVLSRVENLAEHRPVQKKPTAKKPAKRLPRRRAA